MERKGSRPTISIFLPAFNEAANLEASVSDVVKAAEEIFQDYEVLIVDDGSTDGTAAIAETLARNNAKIRVFHHPRNLGVASGFQTALERAAMGYFVFLPADHEVSPDSVREIFESVGTADIIAPYHWNTWDRPWLRRLMTWTCTTLINALFGLRMRYYLGPCVYPTPLARLLPRTNRRFFFLAEMLVYARRIGFGIREVGLIHRERSHGRSKAVSLANILDALATIFRLWWSIQVGEKHLPLRQELRSMRPTTSTGVQQECTFSPEATEAISARLEGSYVVAS